VAGKEIPYGPSGVRRRVTRRLLVGDVPVGGGAPVSVQSMTRTPTADAKATCGQIRELADAGCDIVRVAVPNEAAAAALPEIVRSSPIPVIADIHFRADLALAALDAGVHGLRINPGNIRGEDALRQIVESAAARGAPIRVGVNSGSLEKPLLQKYGGPTAEALAESAEGACKSIEDYGWDKIKVSIKSSDVAVTVAANRLFAARTDYPLHLGVTEAGAGPDAVVKSAVGIGALLLDGIGDTIRVSLTGAPIEEVRTGLRILKACGLRSGTPDIIACPMCGRAGIDVLKIVLAIEDEINRIVRSGMHIPFRKIAVMGCVVNGPGEAREADIGVAGGRERGVLFRRGEVVETIPESELAARLISELRRAARDARDD